MTQFTKISLTALFALFLTACDKPAENTATPTPDKASVQPQQDVVSDEQGAAEFKIMMMLDNQIGQILLPLQQDFNEKLSEGNPNEVLVSYNVFNDKINEILRGLELLDIKSPDVLKFKQKIQQMYSISNSLNRIVVNRLFGQTEENARLLEQNAKELKQVILEFEQLQKTLQQKFGQ